MVFVSQWNMVNINPAMIRGSLCHPSCHILDNRKLIWPAIILYLVIFALIYTNYSKFCCWYTGVSWQRRYPQLLVQITVPALWLVYFRH
jgi:hypothetical protein